MTEEKAALRAAQAMEGRILTEEWVNPDEGRITFATYVTERYLKNLMVESSTRDGYCAVLNAHLLPTFGRMQMAKVEPATVQAWVTAKVNGRELSAVSVIKYHSLLHTIFKQAVQDRWWRTTRARTRNCRNGRSAGRPRPGAGWSPRCSSRR